MNGTPRARRAVAAIAVAAMFAAGSVLLAPAAAAAPLTETISFDEATTAPTGGTLANQVGFGITAGSGQGAVWELPNGDTPVMYFFDRPVDIRLGVTGLNADGEQVELPEGVELEALADGHTWDAVTRIVGGPDGTGDGVSTFTLADTTALRVMAVGSQQWSRALAFVEVTYNVPVSTIVSPANGGTYTVGDGTTLDFRCSEGTGEVLHGGATINGQPIANGEGVDKYGPGTWTIDVACVDQNGAISTSSVTFDVVLPEPECTEDGFLVFTAPYIDLSPPSNGVSDGVHNHTEPMVDEVVDPLVTSLGLPALQPLVHDLNCELIVPVEDTVDEILIPVAVEVNKLLGRLFR